MKKIFLLLVLISFFTTNAQEKYFTKTGSIDFEASVPSFEEVKAKNNKVTAILKTSTGEIAALVLVKGFRFKVALMEEHFNENYAESDTYPKAKFSGKIKDFDLTSYKENTKETINITGKLTFHGKTKIVEIPGALIKKEGIIQILANFTVKASDFDINIPSILRKKVSKSIQVALSFELKKK